MNRHRLLTLIAIVSLVAPALLAGGLEKYKEWPSSPQGYFMTGAESAEWKATVKTDAEAEQFIKKFIASRGPGFVEDVAKRADVADKHLTVGGRAGSLTTRGKIVILLGPPSSFSIVSREITGDRSASAGMYAGASNDLGSRGAHGVSAQDMIDAANRSTLSLHRVSDYAFTYGLDKLPVKRAAPLQVIVEVDPSEGSDRINDRKQAAELDQIFEAVAAARLSAAAARKP
jgi:GWxTD domain-containing protein